ncbi:MAG: hypothetical protein AB2385_14710 [Symbiobacterium sp.]|uniref:hypothetical protein n=1 Tax=Symbiobacterium sp. TaxID=1971213 RepID=UPI003463ACF9
MATPLADRFAALRAAFLTSLEGCAEIIRPEAARPLLEEFGAFLDASELAPEQLSAEVLEFYLYACARDGAGTAALEERILALKALFAWAAHTKAAPDLAAGLAPLTRRGAALAELIYHRWPPAGPVFVPLNLD